jgi:hypothetical protein
MYNVYSFLEPLGLISAIPLPIPVPAPTPSQESAGDPWFNTFPPDRKTYKLHDEEDDTYRCPNCLHEVCDDRCDHCDAEFSGSDEDDFEIGAIEFEEDGVGGIRRRGARVEIAHVEDVLGDNTDDDTPAMRRRRRRVAEQNGMFHDLEAEDVDQDMDDTGSESGSEGESIDDGGLEVASDSGSSEFARPRTDIEPVVYDTDSDIIADDQSDNERPPGNFINLVTGELGGAGARDPRPQPRQTARRTNGPPGAHHQHQFVESEAEDDEDEDEMMSYQAGPQEDVYDSEEDDGSVPRILYTRPHRARYDDEDEEEDDEEDQSAYEDSFIDDGESNDTENENDAEGLIPLASSDHEDQAGPASEGEEREEDGAGSVPNIQEMRRRRLEALLNARR